MTVDHVTQVLPAPREGKRRRVRDKISRDGRASGGTSPVPPIYGPTADATWAGADPTRTVDAARR